MAKEAVRKAPTTPEILVCECPMLIYFSREVMAERETFRRLAHRAVDLAIDSGHHESLCGELPYSLAYIARDKLINKVTDFVQEVRAEEKQARH